MVGPHLRRRTARQYVARKLINLSGTLKNVDTNTEIDFVIFTSPILEELVAKVARKCLKSAKQNELVNRCGYKSMDYYE